MAINIIRRSRLWLTVSASIVGLSVLSLIVFGLNPGIDFRGGVLLELDFEQPVTQEDVRQAVLDAGHDATVQMADDGGAILRLAMMTEEQHQSVLTSLKERFGDVIELQYTSVDPLIGAQLAKQAIIAVVLVLLLIALYIAWAFRRVSEPVTSWKYGVVTLVAAFHDVVIPLGVFALLGRIFGFEVDTAFIAAALTVLGYSINDTIVVFDRTRENLHRHRHGSLSFGEIVNRSVNETLARSLNTTLCVLLPVLAIILFGGESTRPFAVVLLSGIIAGAYSSIFLASPLLVLSEQWGKKE